jgi:hypothetical protein
MAFNFLGTFSAAEVQALLLFAQDQLPDIDAKVAYLQGQINRVGWIQYTLDEQRVPASYVIEPENSLLAKYVRSYQFYGGDLLELSVRSRGQWISFTQAEPSLDSNQVSDAGSLVGTAQVQDEENLHADDIVPAIAVSKVKDFITPAIQGKREHYEFKIKKAIDLADQYLEEIILLVRRATDGDESLEFLQQQIQFYLNDAAFPSAGRKPRL